MRQGIQGQPLGDPLQKQSLWRLLRSVEKHGSTKGLHWWTLHPLNSWCIPFDASNNDWLAPKSESDGPTLLVVVFPIGLYPERFLPLQNISNKGLGLV